MSQSPPQPNERPAGTTTRLKELFLGKPKSLEDPNIFHTVSLIAFLAWVGLGADGLSSSAYGPEEAFKALLTDQGDFTFLAIFLALATALTVIIISASYMGVIEHFPFGGGGYAVATKLLGERFGVISGSALLVDYVLTITTSVASGADQIFSFLPAEWAGKKLVAEAAVIVILVVMNIRGVRESVTALAPLFLIFLVTHAVTLAVAIGSKAYQFPVVAHEVSGGFGRGMSTLGMAGMLALFLRAYSLGGGTYTGIEAVSNGLPLMREPKVLTAKKTMIYMAISLSVTAAGIVISYLLLHVQPATGKTMNAVLLETLTANWQVGGIDVGRGFQVVTLLSEGALLFVASMGAFVAGPRVMANMATDSWLPHRFSSLSDRLTMQDGVLLMGGASLLTLFYAQGDVGTLVTMYSINVFLTFSLSQLAMARYFITRRRRFDEWLRKSAIQVIALLLCGSILMVTTYEKFYQGGWITVTVTTTLVVLCFMIRRHYGTVRTNLKRLDEILGALPSSKGKEPVPVDPKAPTAAILVSGYSGLGVHLLLTIQRIFPGYFKNFVFISVGVIDSATFKNQEEVDRVKHQTQEGLDKYLDLAVGLQIPAVARTDLGTEPVAVASEVAIQVAKEFPRVVFFSGKLVFEQERWYQRLLHNETAYSIQRRLQFAGQQAMVLPVRVMEEKMAS
jgi:amino acid transporter